MNPLRGIAIVSVLATSTAGAGFAQGSPSPVRAAGPDVRATPEPLALPAAVPSLRLDLPPLTAVLYDTGETVELPVHAIWRPACSGGDVSYEELQRMVLGHYLAAVSGPATVVDSGARAGFDLVYVVSGSIPSGALAAISAAESYLEGLFTDPITVTIAVSFQPLGPGVLGGTGSTYGYVSYTGTRQVLVAGMDGNDTLQTWLPAGSTCPVRYSSSSAVTNENRVFFTLANYKATAAFVAGTDANMTFSSTFAFDFDPSNGITTNTYSFQDVVIHETGHALGFTSGGDFRVKDMEVLDLFRFQRTDGSGDYNPDTVAEFQVRPRLVAFNKPNDDHNSDLISAEYRMSDGSPYQMSHLREQAANIGLMDPALAPGETWWPAFFSQADVNLFDAIGYDR